MAELTKVLIGCYRTGEANDPEIYADAVIAVLSDYPMEVVRRVVDPRRGLPSKTKWLPTIAEVKEACESEMGPIRRAQADEGHERRITRQLAERAEAERQDREARTTGAHDRVATGLRGLVDELRDRSRPQDEIDKAKMRRDQVIERGNRYTFERECRDAGIDPGAGVSPSLRNLLAQQGALKEAAE